jgi:hypothetical protein
MVVSLRRCVAPLVAASLLTMFPGVVSGAAAAPVHASTDQVAVGTCPKPKPYPPSPSATVQVDTTVPNVGDPLEISGIAYCPDEDVELTIAGEHVGTAHTDAAGNFDPSVTTPGPPGPKQVCGIGASGLATDRDCLLIQVGGAGTGGSSSPPSGGGTSFTGVQIALLGLLALVLVVGGVVVTTLGRNRNPHRA